MATIEITEGATGRGSGRFFANLSVQAKILSALAISVLVGIMVGLVTLHGLGKARDAAGSIYTSNVASIRAVGAIRATTLQARLDLANQLISPDAAGIAQYTQAFNADLTNVAAAITAYEASHPAGSPDVISDTKSTWQAYIQIAQTKQLPAGARNDLVSWRHTRDTEILPLMSKLTGDLNQLQTAEVADAAKAAETAKSGYRSSLIQAVTLLTAGSLLALLLGAWVARRIVASLRRVEDVCRSLAAGDLTRSTSLTSGDEPGRMGRALDSAMIRLRQAMTTIGGSASTLAAASEELSAVSSQLQSGATDAAEKATTAKAATEEVNIGIQSIAAGAEEMSASIGEIASNASQAAEIAQSGMAVAARTNSQVSELGTASTEISDVVKLITSIAEQTNLLALNATIEAARAGELGKGFAVVANEVKELAQQTASATEQITARIGAIQTSSGSAADAIGEITEVIGRIGDYTTTIASAVEEQTATTGEMSRSVTEAATSSSDVARTVSGVAEVAAATAEGARATQQAAVDLTRLASDLTQLVNDFRH